MTELVVMPSMANTGTQSLTLKVRILVPPEPPWCPSRISICCSISSVLGTHVDDATHHPKLCVGHHNGHLGIGTFVASLHSCNFTRIRASCMLATHRAPIHLRKVLARNPKVSSSFLLKPQSALCSQCRIRSSLQHLQFSSDKPRSKNLFP